MAHYAYLDSENKVINVIVGKDEDDLLDGEVVDWEAKYLEIASSIDSNVVSVKRTSYNTYNNVHINPETGEASDTQEKAFRGNYAHVDCYYYPDEDLFMQHKPYDSWTIDTENAKWVSPVPIPADIDTTAYFWDETNQQWVEGAYPYKPNNNYT